MRETEPSVSAQLTQLPHTIARRGGRLLEREGLLQRDTEQLDLGEMLDEDDPAASQSEGQDRHNVGTNSLPICCKKTVSISQAGSCKHRFA